MTGLTVGVRVNVAGSNSGALRQTASGARAVGSSATGATRGIRGFTLASSGMTRGLGFLGGATRGASNMIGGLGRTARGSIGAVGGITRSLFSLQGVLIGIAALAVGGSLFDKLIGGNSQLQSQQLGLAATIGANLKFVDSQGRVLKSGEAFQKSMMISSKMVEQFRQDALKAPGSSQDLIQLFQGAVNPSLAAGKSLPEIRKITNEALTFAKVIGNDIPQASRDLQLLLTGNAGMDNRTWQLLASSVGYTAEQFNKLPAPERFKLLSGAFKEFATPEVVNAYAASWDGLTSSLGDLIDQTLLVVGGPVFKELSKLIGEAVTYLSDPKNKKEINAFASSLGTGIAGGIRTVVSVGRDLLEWFGEAKQGVGLVSDALGVFWTFLSVNVIPILAFFGSLIGVVFEGFNAWLGENQALVQIAGGNLLALGGFLLQVGAAIVGIMALGFATAIIGIATAVIWLSAKFNAFVQFAKSVPDRLGIVFDRMKLGFFRLGLAMLENVKQNPIFSFLFGLTGIDKALGQLQSAADQMDRAIGNREARVNLQQIAADPTDPRAQYQASRQLAAGGAPVNVNVTNVITTSDPEAAGAAAARGTGTAVKRGVQSGRTGSDAVTQASTP